jgi:hypothetical protein
MRRERCREVRRSRLLLAFEEDLEVRGQRNLRGVERVDRREQRDDRSLVVAGRARVDARLVGERILRVGPGDDLSAVLPLAVPQDGLEGRRLPGRFGPDRLAVDVLI